MIKTIKLCVAAIKVIYHNAFLSIFRVPAAALYCKLLLKNRQTHYIVICDHIGDFLITMGYLTAYKQHNQKHITVCIANQLQELLNAYPFGWDQYVQLPSVKLYKLLTIGATNFGIHILKKFGNITLVNPADAFAEEAFQYIMRYPTITLKDCIQYGCLHLDKDASFFPPHFEEKADLENISGFQKGKTVLLSPYARAVSVEDIKIFTVLARLLKKQGFVVLTNISDSRQKPVPGTQSVTCTLTQVVSLVRTGGYVVGIRSGLLDLLAYTKCTMVAIYPDLPGNKSFFDLEQLPEIQAKILQISTTNSIRHDVKRILDFLQGGKTWQ